MNLDPTLIASLTSLLLFFPCPLLMQLHQIAAGARMGGLGVSGHYPGILVSPLVVPKFPHVSYLGEWV